MANRLELIDAYLDGVLDDEVVRQLEADLVADPALARQLAQRSLFHARLRDLYLIDRRTAPAAAPTLSGASPRSVWYKKGIRGQGSGISFKAGVAFAALLLIAAALLYVFVPSTPHSELPTPHVAAPVTYAMLSDVSPDAQFADTDHALGSDLAGPIKLVSGKAQLMFKSAAVVDLTGPCEFEMTGVNRGRLMRGGLSALVRPEARGFTVDLPGGVEIVDLGTAFDVNVSDGHSIDVLVTRGAVRVQSPRLDPRILTAGQHVALRDGALLPPTMLVSATTSRRAKYPIVRGGFVDGAKAYIDRDYTWQGVNAPTCPPILRGADFVQTSNEDKSDAHLSVKLTLDGPATVWVLWNPRAPLPQWLTEAFEQTPWTVTLSIEQGQFVSEDRDLAYSVWRRRVDAAGVVTLGPRAIENDPTIAGMYGLVVTPPDASPSQSPDQSSPPTQPAQRSK